MSKVNNQESQRGIRYTVIILVTIVITILVGFSYKLTLPRVLNQQELRENGALVLDKPRRFSDFELQDHQGNAFSRERLNGKWSLIYFGFTHCPDACPTALAAAAKMYRHLKPEEQQDLQVILISLDPERDTPPVLAKYVPYFHPDFIGVSGNPHVTLKLATELNVAYTQVPLGEDDYTVEHTGNLLLINPYGDYHALLRPPFEEGSMRVAWRSIRYSFEK